MCATSSANFPVPCTALWAAALRVAWVAVASRSTRLISPVRFTSHVSVAPATKAVAIPAVTPATAAPTFTTAPAVNAPITTPAMKLPTAAQITSAVPSTTSALNSKDQSPREAGLEYHSITLIVFTMKNPTTGTRLEVVRYTGG